MAGIDDLVPAELAAHAVQQGRNAGIAEIGDGAVVGAEKGELFMLRADAEALLRLAAGVEIFGEFRNRRDRRLVGRVAGHEVTLISERRLDGMQAYGKPDRAAVRYGASEIVSR